VKDSIEAGLVAELAEAASELHALAARITKIKERVKRDTKPLPKSWATMEAELLGLRARVITTLRAENWSYRRIADVVGITHENVRRTVGRIERKQRMAVVRAGKKRAREVREALAELAIQGVTTEPEQS
jgi:hypothetical protein